MKTLIGVPCMDMIHTRFVCSLMGMERVGQTHVDFKVGSLVYDSRHQITIIAMQEEADRILMIDSDMTFEPDLMKRLSADMDEGRELVAGLCFRRRMPLEPVIYRNLDEPALNKDGIPIGNLEPYYDYPRDSIFKVDGCGFGCVMMTTDLVKRVWDKFGPPFSPLPWAGEDVSFCYRVKQLGVDMWCDSRVKVGHVGQIEYTEDMFLKSREGR